MKKTALVASILSVLLLAGCSQDAEQTANKATTKAKEATATAAQKVEKKAGEVAKDMKQDTKVWTLNEVQSSSDFVAVAKDQVGTSYVYKPSIEVKEDDGKQEIEAVVWRDYVLDKHLIKEEQEYKYDPKTMQMELAMDDVKVYTYDGKFVKDGEDSNMKAVEKGAYGYVMGQNILRVKKGEVVKF